MATTELHVSLPSAAVLARQPVVTVPRALSNAVVIMLFAHLWFSQSTLKVAQVGVELMLGCTLLWLLSKCRLRRAELGLLILFGLSVVASTAVNTLPVTLLMIKVFGLSVLSLLVFSKLRFDMSWAIWIAAANAAVTLYQAVFGNPAWFLSIMLTVGDTWRDWVESRPLGLFMSTHASATVSAVFFLWLASRRTVMGGAGLVLLVLNASTNVLGAYLLQLTHRILAWLRIDKIAVVAGIAVVVLAIAYAEAVLHFELSTVSAFFSGREQGSFATIISQLLSPQSYVRAFTLWPGDPELLHEELIDAWPNEIAYLSVLQQAGWIFGGVYLAMLFRRIPGFRVLIGVALLHFAMTTIPLIIFLLVQWARDSAPNARQHGEYSIFRPHEN